MKQELLPLVCCVIVLLFFCGVAAAVYEGATPNATIEQRRKGWHMFWHCAWTVFCTLFVVDALSHKPITLSGYLVFYGKWTVDIWPVIASSVLVAMFIIYGTFYLRFKREEQRAVRERIESLRRENLLRRAGINRVADQERER